MEDSMLNFADNLFGRNFVADVNITLATIVELSNCTTVDVTKDAIIDSMNKNEKKNIGTNTEDGAVWDDIFDELIEYQAIETDTHTVRLTDSLIQLIEQSK